MGAGRAVAGVDAVLARVPVEAPGAGAGEAAPRGGAAAAVEAGPSEAPVALRRHLLRYRLCWINITSIIIITITD